MTQLPNEEHHRFVEADRQSERLAKLKLGLRLLRKVKAAHGETPRSDLFIEPLHADSPVEIYIQAISTLGDQAALNTHDHDLQDACLLTEDALHELTPHEFAVANAYLHSVFSEWSQLPPSAAKPEAITASDNDAIDNKPTDSIPDSDNEPDSLPVVTDCTNETLVLGLQLLQAFKTAHETSVNTLFIAPLSSESSIEDAIQAIKTLADQAAQHEHYADLQDACLLIEEALYDVSADEFAATKMELLSVLNDWALSSHSEPEVSSVDNADFDNEPTDVTDSSDSESEIIITDNTSFDDEPASSIATKNAYIHSIATIEQLANELDAEGYTCLYSLSLLITDALHELSRRASIAKTDLPSLLDNWLSLINAYRDNSLDAVHDIISILRHPELNIPFDEEDFATFTTLLIEEIGTKNAVTEPQADISDEAPVLSSAATENDDDEVAEILSPMAQELVELLDTEAGLLNYRFLAVSFDEPLATRAEHLQQASEELDRLANASTMIGFAGLSEVCQQVNANIALYLQHIDSFTADNRDLLVDWVAHVKAYLLTFSKKDAGKSLLAQLSQPNWIQPLSPEASAVLLPKMRVTGLNEESAEEDTREKIATDDNISLALPDDVNKELLDLLLQELPAYTQQFSEAIQRLHAGGSSKDIDVAQRIAHTIKGSANTVGIKGIAVLTHQMEDILMACAKARKQPNAALMSTLLNASDCLEAMCESLLGQGEPPQDAQEVLQEVLDWANQIAKNGIQDDVDVPQPPVKQPFPVEAKITQSPTPEPVTPAPKETPTENSDTTPVAMVRVPTDQIENLFKLSGESIILNGQIYERQRRLKNQLQVMEAQFTLLQQLGAELEQLIDLKDLSGRSTVNTGKDFDVLEMDQYNELHTASRRMVEASVDAREISVDMKKELETMNEVLEYQQRLVINTQEAVMQTRFVPVGSITLRLQRGLRQTCRLTGKQGELTVLGENLLIDGDTLSALIEPLMHLLRNAVDHGLESEEERIAMGKPPVGQITIEFDREGNSILVRCRDDGRGLDFGAIRYTAEQRGDVRSGDTVTEDELKRLILRPNFSTRTQSTQTSGRGVGMDVVNFQALSLGGSLSLHSVRGQGLTVELRVPLPLSRSHALLANAGAYKVAISSKGLTQILYSGAGEIKTISHEQILMIGDDIYPVVKLEDLLHIQDRRKERRSHGAVLLVENGGKMTAVLVDSITDSREVVIKNLGYYMKKIHGFVGATILGDGSVTPVLDIPELLRAPVYKQESSYSATTNTAEPRSNQHRILIVDDSLSQRRALEHILTDAGFHVHTARDGIEAVEWLAHNKPAVVVTDLEMPRMNGLELASHIRTQERLKNLPIIMITSRSTQKHRQMADEMGIDFYLVKPVQDDNLLINIQTLIDKQSSAVAV
ncbi:MAG: response regulator [Methylococcales bacterium]|nr:response regulator [Methylococcales bacterium]